MKNSESQNNKAQRVSPQTIKRLPAYLMYLQKVAQKGDLSISAPRMGADLEADPTQIVKDLSVTGIKGKPRVGYNVTELIHTIENYLGFNKNNEAFLIGAGKLGQAILSYHELQGFGIRILAAFDIDESKINQSYGNVKILHFKKLGELANRLGISIGILTTPSDKAQEAAEAMVKSGIKAIWNMTSVRLELPKHVIVQNTSMYADVAILLKDYNDSEA